MKRFLSALTLAVCVAGAGRLRAAAPGTALPPPSTGGLAILDPLLQKLTNNRRLLVIGAHPDDENTALLALVSRKMGGEAAYLSLSRGEGGQNLIGEELGVGLGLIRSQELMAARRLDGARQYFTRAYDFGYTRSLDETLRLWPQADPARGRDARRAPVPAAGHLRDVHGHRARRARPASGRGHRRPRGLPRRRGDPTRAPQLAAEGLTALDALDAATVHLVRPRRRIPAADRGRRAPDGPLLPADRDGEPQPPPLPGHGNAAAARPRGDAVRLGRGGAGPDAKDLFEGVDTHLRSIAAEMTDSARREQAEGAARPGRGEGHRPRARAARPRNARRCRRAARRDPRGPARRARPRAEARTAARQCCSTRRSPRPSGARGRRRRRARRLRGPRDAPAREKPSP